MFAIKTDEEFNFLTIEVFKHQYENNAIYKSHIVTNGLSLKSNIYEELANKFNCTSIEITLDGVKEFHDTRRDTKTKEATFDLIFNNILSITSLNNYPINGCFIKIRCNVDDTNKEGVIPLIELLAENKLCVFIILYSKLVYHAFCLWFVIRA